MTSLYNYIKLMRFDKPIGTLLLLWPTLSALWLAQRGVPPITLIVIFTLGVILMRAAGCIINDIADRNFDGHVERTQARPLVNQKISLKNAVSLFTLLIGLSFFLALQLNSYAFKLSFLAVFLAILYPFTKRWFVAPQLFLGLAFGFGIPMAYAAVLNHIPWHGWLFYLACLIWILAYDTCYAMTDREDDKKLGLFSTAILFEKHDVLIVGFLMMLFFLLITFIGCIESAKMPYFLGLLIGGFITVFQIKLLKSRVRENYFKAFLLNHWIGLTFFVGLLFSFN